MNIAIFLLFLASHVNADTKAMRKAGTVVAEQAAKQLDPSQLKVAAQELQNIHYTKKTKLHLERSDAEILAARYEPRLVIGLPSMKPLHLKRYRIYFQEKGVPEQIKSEAEKLTRVSDAIVNETDLAFFPAKRKASDPYLSKPDKLESEKELNAAINSKKLSRAGSVSKKVQGRSDLYMIEFSARPADLVDYSLELNSNGRTLTGVVGSDKFGQEQFVLGSSTHYIMSWAAPLTHTLNSIPPSALRPMPTPTAVMIGR